MALVGERGPRDLDNLQEYRLEGRETYMFILYIQATIIVDINDHETDQVKKKGKKKADQSLLDWFRLGTIYFTWFDQFPPKPILILKLGIHFWLNQQDQSRLINIRTTLL